MSIEFVASIYELTNSFPKSEIYGITNQLRRAAVSISSNISEGAARNSAIERKRFFEVARSSLVEIDTQLEISIKLGYCPIESLEAISEKLNHIFAMLSRLIQKS